MITGRTLYTKLRQLLKSCLSAHGFVADPSKGVFYRDLGNGVWHFIYFIKLRQWSQFGIWIGPNSTALYPKEDWEAKFPKGLGFPFFHNTLGEDGVGSMATRDTFFCKTVEVIEREVERRIIPALQNFGLPYLDKFRSLEDIVPHICPPIMLARGLMELGQEQAACEVVSVEIARIQKINADYKIKRPDTHLDVCKELLRQVSPAN